MTRMFSRCLAIFALALASAALAADAPDAALRLKHFTVSGDAHLALQGYDPMSYFEGKAQKGDPAHAFVYGGVTYRFASAAHLEKFKEKPAAFEPTYGGWCAWAMLDGDKVEPNPESFKISDGRLFLFYNGWLGNTLKKWDKKAKADGEAKLITTADAAWAKIFK